MASATRPLHDAPRRAQAVEPARPWSSLGTRATTPARSADTTRASATTYHPAVSTSPLRVANEVVPGRIAGRVTVPRVPVPVEATIEWTDGRTETVAGRALSWTTTAVHVDWYDSTGYHGTAWLPDTAVRRR